MVFLVRSLWRHVLVRAFLKYFTNHQDRKFALRLLISVGVWPKKNRETRPFVAGGRVWCLVFLERSRVCSTLYEKYLIGSLARPTKDAGSVVGKNIVDFNVGPSVARLVFGVFGTKSSLLDAVRKGHDWKPREADQGCGQCSRQRHSRFQCSPKCGSARGQNSGWRWHQR